MRKRVAFYAPLKSPDHDVPSGERTVARLYRQALEQAGFDVALASAFRSLDKRGDAASQQALMQAAAAEVAAVIAALQPNPPALWFTYHCHYKAPDLIGPAVSAALAIPYAVVEPSHAPKRANGPWAAFHVAAATAIAGADLAICATRADIPCVEALRPEMPTMLLPPFMDTTALPEPRLTATGGPLRLITVAMMREGDKLASYRLLAQVLAHLPANGWSLTIVGDGPARTQIEALFRPFGAAVSFAGLLDRAGVAAALGAAEVFVWPAVNEAYGMALLEAQAMGLPVVAGREGGVADVMIEGETGVLAGRRDPVALAAAIAALMADPARRAIMGQAAAAFVRGERGVETAAVRLQAALLTLLGRY